MALARSFDAELAALHAAGALTAGEALPAIRKALGSRNNLVVSTAAKYAVRLGLDSLVDALARAFQRFMPGSGKPAKTDPQCWAKIEVAKALAAFEYQEPEVFLAGLRHVQLEPVWGGASDTAGPLRGTCALALVQCRGLSCSDVLKHLLPLFADHETSVRVDVCRAVEQLGTEGSVLLLRLRAELASNPSLGADEPEVVAACIGGVLRLEGETMLPWVAQFLGAGDDLASETAFLLAEHRSPGAALALQQAFESALNREFRSVLITALAAMQSGGAQAWLLQLVGEGGLHARAAAQALLNAEPSADVARQLETLGYPGK